jgi:hypothetical protein
VRLVEAEGLREMSSYPLAKALQEKFGRLKNIKAALVLPDGAIYVAS